MCFGKIVNITLSVCFLLCFAGRAAAEGPASVQSVNELTAVTLPAGGAAGGLDDGYAYRGILIGADHGEGDIHHDNVYVSINGGPVMYQTTIPARKAGNLLPDAGLLWHFYTRDDTEITVYATSAWQNGVASALSLPFPLPFLYPQPATCTEQTVPVAVAGDDQLVNVGEQVTLDGSLSYDAYAADNSSLIYRWECYSAPESAVTLSDEGQADVITFTPNAPGNYYFRFNVRDDVDGSSFNRSPVAYVRVAAVEDMDRQPYISANAGRTSQAQVGQVVTLDAGQSRCSSPVTSFVWSLENPLDSNDIVNISNSIGTTGCQENCYLSNFDADSDVDGMDLAILADNYSGLDLPDQEVVQFVAGISRPHIFKLTISDGTQTDSETTIVAVNHENANSVLTHPEVEESCLE